MAGSGVFWRQKYSMYGIEQSFGMWEIESSLAHCAPMHRRLEDRIRELCAKALTAQESELHAILSALRSALREHAERLRRLAASKLVSVEGYGDRLQDRRSA